MIHLWSWRASWACLWAGWVFTPLKGGTRGLQRLGGLSIHEWLAQPERGPWWYHVQMTCGRCVELRWAAQDQRGVGGEAQESGVTGQRHWSCSGQPLCGGASCAWLGSGAAAWKYLVESPLIRAAGGSLPACSLGTWVGRGERRAQRMSGGRDWRRACESLCSPG